MNAQDGRIGVSEGAGASGVLQALREDVVRARFRRTIPRLERYVARADLGASERLEALELLAISQIALRDEAGADETLSRLYARDPGFRPSLDMGPRVTAAFRRARERQAARVQPEPAMSLTLLAEGRLHVRVQTRADLVQQVRLSYREQGQGARLRMQRAGDASWRAVVPGHVGPTQIVVEALAPSGHVLAREHRLLSGPRLARGQARQEPLEATAAEVDSPVVTERWWFWSAAAVVVAGAVTGALLLAPSDGGLPQTTLDSGALQ